MNNRTTLVKTFFKEQGRTQHNNCYELLQEYRILTLEHYHTETVKQIKWNKTDGKWTGIYIYMKLHV